MATGRSDAESAIRALSDALVRYFNAGDANGLVEAVYSEDARLFPPNMPVISGLAQIRESFREFLAAGMGGLTVETFEVEVAASGDLAYAAGTFVLTRPVVERSKFVEIYRSQADGSWKCIIDMFSSDEPDVQERRARQLTESV